MPSFRVTTTTLSLSAFDVVGQDGNELGFIRHAGLAESTGTQNVAQIPVLDMGPPLHGQGAPNRVTASVVGTATLTDDEVRKFKTYVDRHASEHLAFRQVRSRDLIKAAPQIYCIHPHACPVYEDDGRYARMRFSCAGFVLEAYNKARIKQLNVDVLPMVNWQTIQAAYPAQTHLMESGRIDSQSLGLEGSGPWPVLLCGYLFHALNRDADAIRREPYVPSIEDRNFI